MSANAQYILLLVVAVALTFVVGQLLIRAGEPFLFEVFQDRKVTRSVNLLLSVLFYLITLGVLAIIGAYLVAGLVGRCEPEQSHRPGNVGNAVERHLHCPTGDDNPVARARTSKREVRVDIGILYLCPTSEIVRC